MKGKIWKHEVKCKLQDVGFLKCSFCLVGLKRVPALRNPSAIVPPSYVRSARPEVRQRKILVEL